MSEKTEIAWTDSTFNPWWGCTKISEGCTNCYAETLDKRTGGAHWGPGAERRRTSVKNWNDPIRWNKKSGAFFAEHGRRQRVFCASMADVFDNEVDPAWRTDLFDLIARTPNLDWLLLTKRIGNVTKMLPSNTSCCEADGFARLWPHVWLGATICNQEEADRDIPKLLSVPAAMRFLSIEPLLGPVDITYTGTDGHDGHYPLRRDRNSDGTAIDWVIVGGESGPNARPMHPDWARSLRDQCQASGVPFLFKQWGEWAPDWEGAMTCAECGKTKFDWAVKNDKCGYCESNEWNEAARPLDSLRRVGKKAAGRLIDGRTWDEVPV